MIKDLLTPHPSISPEELALRREELGNTVLLLDVREQRELDIARIDPCMHIPLGQLRKRVGELEPWRGREIVTMCHHGFRSASAQRFLLGQGFEKVLNLSGGIHAYAARVDRSMRRH
jgi:rhodanese-related sulfurtransferase